MQAAGARDWLRARGVSEDEIDRWQACGLPPQAAQAAVVDKRLRGRLRRALFPAAPLSALERQQLSALVALVDAVVDLNGMEKAPRFWGPGPVPWLGNLSPLEALYRHGGIGWVDDLVYRIRHGIYP
jgi:uncharacterized protein (DUF2384 family)